MQPAKLGVGVVDENHGGHHTCTGADADSPSKSVQGPVLGAQRRHQLTLTDGLTPESCQKDHAYHDHPVGPKNISCQPEMDCTRTKIPSGKQRSRDGRGKWNGGKSSTDRLGGCPTKFCQAMPMTTMATSCGGDPGLSRSPPTTRQRNGVRGSGALVLNGKNRGSSGPWVPLQAVDGYWRPRATFSRPPKRVD